MTPFLKVSHVLGLAVLIGSILGHIVLAQTAAPTDASYAWAQAAKHQSTLLLTLPGLAIIGLSGLLLTVRRGLVRRRWLQVKVALVALVGLNGALILSPLGAELAARAAAGAPAEVLLDLSAREALFGAVNLTLIVVVVALAIIRPRLGQSRREAA